MSTVAVYRTHVWRLGRSTTAHASLTATRRKCVPSAFSHAIGPRSRAGARQRRGLVGVRATSESPDDSVDDEPLVIKLSPEQARIAALAFEVLYEKPSISESLLEDNERPGLRLRLQQAIKAAQEACDEGATIECAVAWEEVDELEDAAMRAGMSQTAPYKPEGLDFQPGPATTTPPKPTVNEGENPARRMGDLLQGVSPCRDDNCEPAQGTLQARADFERMLREGTESKLSERLGEAIEEAVERAMALCENGGNAQECAVAWDTVEELSSSANNVRMQEREDDAASAP